MDPETDLPECCGSGCTNCVLDQKTTFRKSLASAGDRPNILDSHYKPFRCVSISRCTTNTFRFRFQYQGNTGNDSELRIPAGSHLLLRTRRDWRLTVEGQRRRFNEETFSEWRAEAQRRRRVLAPIVNNGVAETRVVEKYDKSERDLYFSRPYTPVRVDPDRKSFDVLIKMEVDGEMSEYLQSLAVGDEAEWKGVYTGFVWERNSRKSLVCFAQGVGLAPVYSIIGAVLDDEEDETRLKLCYCCQDVDSILMRKELLDFGRYWNFEAIIYLSREDCSCGGKPTKSCSCVSSKRKYNEKIFNHRLEKTELESLLHRHALDSLQILICGTDSFASFIVNCLTELNIKDYYKF